MNMTAELGAGEPPLSDHRTSGPRLTGRRLRGRLRRRLSLLWLNSTCHRVQMPRPAGLTPTVRGSDRVAPYGHISKQGSAWLRWVLCEAAQTAKRSPQFATGYQAIARRRGKKIATTAVARKLLTRAWHLLADAEQTAALKPAAPPDAAR
jgi:hypothetical protein